MTTERKKLGFELFLSNYFSNFGKFTLVNLIFAVPLSLAFGVSFLLSWLFPQASVWLLPLTILLSTPFYSGVLVLSRKIYNDDITDNLLKEFFSAVKENIKAFLVHSVVAYCAVVGCYQGVVIYLYLASQNWIFYMFLFSSALIALFLLFLLYAAPLMSCSFELSLKNVYKNSALMTFGELKANFLTTVAIFAYLAVVTLPLMFFFQLTSVWGVLTSIIVIYAYLALLMILLVPTGVGACLVAFIYPNMKRVITGEAKANLEAVRAEEKLNAEKLEENKDRQYSDVDVESIKKSDSEYVFYNGRMVKKSVLLEEIELEEELENDI